MPCPPLFSRPIAQRTLVSMLLGFACLLSCLSVQGADDDDDDLPDYRPGLVACYSAGGSSIVRRDLDVQFVWNGPPDPRLPSGKFSATWQGRLLALAPGKYQLHIYAAGGDVRLKLKGETALAEQSTDPRWLTTKAIELEYGYHPLELEFRASGRESRIGLYWSGPQFQLEPISDRSLLHEPGKSPAARFEQGQLLARALRCGACHEVASEQASLTAPALTHLRESLSADWIAAWLQAPQAMGREAADSAVTHVSRRMPHFGFASDDARAIAAYLGALSKPLPPHVPPKPVAAKPATDSKKKSNKKSSPKKPRLPSAAEGETLVNTLGCLACHKVGERGTAGLFGGGDLTSIADKRPSDFFDRWLADPAETNPAHRMPVFKLDATERADLVAYLSTLRKAAESKARSSDEYPSGVDLIERGKKLVVEHRCGTCHLLPEGKMSAALKKPLDASSRWNQGCLGEPDRSAHRPGYRLTQAQVEALKTYFSDLKPTAPATKLPIDGEFVLTERNCLACHARGASPGIAAQLDGVVKADARLAPLLPALAPPALLGVGDKLHDEALQSAILLKNPPLRPWLSIRMPRFNLSPAEMQAATDYLVQHDRIPDLPALSEDSGDGPAQALAGSRLVTSDGFGCTSCHQIGSSVPQKAPLAARGTNLSLLGTRVRRSWYDRWVRNPSRIVPRMEMPAIQLPVRGVLHENLVEQLAAVWDVLNRPGFDPPQPSPVRVVRARNVPGFSEPAAVLTDLMEVGPTVFLEPIVIGLANRHNILFDRQAQQLAAWWIGDTARERTRGKSWFWEAGGEPLFPVIKAGPSRSLSQDSPSVSGISIRTRGDSTSGHENGRDLPLVEELDGWSHTADGAEFQHRIHVDDDRSQAAGSVVPTLAVKQRFSSLNLPSKESGFRRRIEIEGLAAEFSVQLQVLTAAGMKLEADGQSASLPQLAGSPRVRIMRPADAKFSVSSGDRPSLTIEAKPSGTKESFVCELEYLVDLPVDQFPVELPSLPPDPPQKLAVVPGYEVIRLPLPSSEMPTGLAWLGDALAFTSLKGQVFLARDSNGDGLEDRMQVFSDDLAAPYGLASHEQGLDVINKFGLLRLYDRDKDGRAEKTEVLASGWGFTSDYHDWAVGLPRDSSGSYYIALPCQQDERSVATARYRGMALKLTPGRSSGPHSYAIEPICAGLRFPMGLALNDRGDLFASDNQGNYTPFNELNHLVAGGRYGFINKLEEKPGYSPPFREPAINIPHPWVRSVNGICFLYTPPNVKEQRGHSLFGPFEGHAVGCEYNNRRLVRMSLERIDGTYQGAIYPLSISPPADAPNFEGPVVCQVAPDGDLYVGSLRDSAWGGGQNTGSIFRLRPSGKLPVGIAEVRATSSGFTLDFTQPVDVDKARQARHYQISSYRRIATPAYGGSDVDRESVRIEKVGVSSDYKRVTLTLDRLRPDFVYEFQVSNLAPAGQEMFPSEAFYTLHRIPSAMKRASP
jgi:cytochrome c2